MVSGTKVKLMITKNMETNLVDIVVSLIGSNMKNENCLGKLVLKK